MNKKHSMKVMKTDKGRYVIHCTYSYLEPIHSVSSGTLGIDIGPKEITCVHVKSDGNPTKKFTYSTGNLLDKKNDIKNLEYSLIIDKIIEYASDNNISITIEDLKFDNNKSFGKRLNRMLKKFNFKKFEELIISKSTRNGIKLNSVNPAYTSIIGLLKYSNRPDISNKHTSISKDYSAAYTIGRRGLGFNEKSVALVNVDGSLVHLPVKLILSSFVENIDRKFSGKNSKSGSNWGLWNSVNKLLTSNPNILFQGKQPYLSQNLKLNSLIVL
jgi:IS605 OrfB family transposase